MQYQRIIGSITLLEFTKTDYDYEKDVYRVLDKITNSEMIINNFEPERQYLKIKKRIYDV